MPGQAPSSRCKIILVLARIRNQATAGAGLAYIVGLIETQGQIITAGGQQMISASAAGKSFAFAAGWTPEQLSDALMEAFGIWQSYDPEQLSSLLDRRPARQTVGAFRGDTSYFPNHRNGWGGC